MWGRKKLKSLDDIKGMKLRVAQPEQGEFVRRFGGTSITMSAPEVPSALDRGVVDGIFTAGVGAVLWKDLLKYGYVLIVNVNNSYFIANTEAFNKLVAGPAGASCARSPQDTARWNQETMQKEEAELRCRSSPPPATPSPRPSPRRIARAVDDHDAVLGRVGEVARARSSSRRWRRCAPRSGARARRDMAQTEQGRGARQAVRAPARGRRRSSGPASSPASPRWS